MLWGNLEAFEQNPAKKLEIEILAIKKFEDIFLQVSRIQHMQLETSGSAKEENNLKFTAYIIQSKGDVALRAESQKLGYF